MFSSPDKKLKYNIRYFVLLEITLSLRAGEQFAEGASCIFHSLLISQVHQVIKQHVGPAQLHR